MSAREKSMKDPPESSRIDVRGIPVVILAGGRGARFDHESQVTPKPMIRVAGKPMLQHIIDGFVAQGFRHFVVATGHLGEHVSRYMADTSVRHVSAGAHDLYWQASGLRLWDGSPDRSLVTVVDTGAEAHTGLRLARAAEFVGARDFVLTYGDGLCDVDMRHLIAVHRREQPHLGPTVTVTAVNPPGRFGVIEMEPASGFPHFRQVRAFDEKPRTEQWINGGFMFVERSFVDEFLGAGEELESGALAALARAGDLCAYCHTGYWRCMDTRRDLEQIEADVAASGGRLPWLLKTDGGGES